MKTTIKYFFITIVVVLFYQCTNEASNGEYAPPADPVTSHPNDLYLYNNEGKSLFERYNTATRWRWNDNFIDPTQRATPVESEFVIPTTRLIEHLWIEPFTMSGANGVAFIDELFPPELVYIGSYIFNDDGSRRLGYAEGGARVTLLNLNSLDFTNENWLSDPNGGILATMHHEFAHIIHGNYDIPVGFNTISDTYLGNNWNNNVSLSEAIKLGMVRNYGTLNEFEDFCEIISHFLVLDKDTFEAAFINQQDCSTLTNADAIVNCRELNQGRLLIKRKLDLVLDYYQDNFNIDLLQVRDIMQSRLDNLIATGVIPD